MSLDTCLKLKPTFTCFWSGKRASTDRILPKDVSDPRCVSILTEPYLHIFTWPSRRAYTDRTLPTCVSDPRYVHILTESCLPTSLTLYACPLWSKPTYIRFWPLICACSGQTLLTDVSVSRYVSNPQYVPLLNEPYLQSSVTLDTCLSYYWPNPTFRRLWPAIRVYHTYRILHTFVSDPRYVPLQTRPYLQMYLTLDTCLSCWPNPTYRRLRLSIRAYHTDRTLPTDVSIPRWVALLTELYLPTSLSPDTCLYWSNPTYRRLCL